MTIVTKVSDSLLTSGCGRKSYFSLLPAASATKKDEYWIFWVGITVFMISIR